MTIVISTVLTAIVTAAITHFYHRKGSAEHGDIRDSIARLVPVPEWSRSGDTPSWFVEPTHQEGATVAVLQSILANVGDEVGFSRLHEIVTDLRDKTIPRVAEQSGRSYRAHLKVLDQLPAFFDDVERIQGKHQRRMERRSRPE